MDKIAIISDIHGNIPALEAVFKDIKQRGVVKIFCLGDLVGKGPNPDLAVDMCREFCDEIIKGNWDDFILRETDYPVFVWHQRRLGRKRLDFLSRLKDTIEYRMSAMNIRLYHASHMGVYYRVRMNDPAEKQTDMFTNTEFTGYAFEPDVIGYGDVHEAFVKTFKNKILFNTGSVGNPLEITQASYALIEGSFESDEPGPFSINLVRVPYDIELAVRQAEQADMPELDLYADELRTGTYRRPGNLG